MQPYKSLSFNGFVANTLINYPTKFVLNVQASLPANCELSDIDYRNIDLTNPSLFSISEDHDFYGRDVTRSLDGCIDGKYILT